MIASRDVDMVRSPRGSHIVIPGFWSSHTRKQSNSLALSSVSKKVGTRCRSPSYERFLEGWSSPFMRLAEHRTALRAWYKHCRPLVGENPTCPVPTEWGCEGLWPYDYGHEHTEYTPPPLPLHLHHAPSHSAGMTLHRDACYGIRVQRNVPRNSSLAEV